MKSLCIDEQHITVLELARTAQTHLSKSELRRLIKHIGVRLDGISLTEADEIVGA